MTRFAMLLMTATMIAGCARTEPASENAGEDVAAPALQQEAGAGERTTPGNWEASAQGESQSVTFRGRQGETLFTIACDLRGGLVVQRPGLVARGNLALMQLRTSDVVRRLAVNAGSGPQPMVEARVPYNDQLIPGLLSFDEPLEVRYEGLENLDLPPNPIVGDLVRTCQQAGGGETPPTPEEAQLSAGSEQPPAEAEGNQQ
jgi:hypothetical protein